MDGIWRCGRVFWRIGRVGPPGGDRGRVLAAGKPRKVPRKEKRPGPKFSKNKKGPTHGRSGTFEMRRIDVVRVWG